MLSYTKAESKKTVGYKEKLVFLLANFESTLAYLAMFRDYCIIPVS